MSASSYIIVTRRRGGPELPPDPLVKWVLLFSFVLVFGGSLLIFFGSNG